jgi:hypothetical protein
MQPRFLFLTSLAFAAAATRLLPHPPNLTAIGALALFCGASFPRWRAALGVPFAALLASDVALYATVYPLSGLAQKPYAYAGFAACVAIGRGLRARRGVPGIGAAGVAAALVFFLIANVGVWLHAGLYPRTAAGLLACYAAALPFLQNMVIGNLLYAALSFGALALAERRGLFATSDATTRTQPAR